MVAGLQVFNELGTAILDSSDSLSRVVGSFDTGTADGSIDVPEFFGARPFIVAMDYSDSHPYGTIRRPMITVSSAKISWTFNVNGPPKYQSVRIVYGVY